MRFSILAIAALPLAITAQTSTASASALASASGSAIALLPAFGTTYITSVTTTTIYNPSSLSMSGTMYSYTDTVVVTEPCTSTEINAVQSNTGALVVYTAPTVTVTAEPVVSTITVSSCPSTMPVVSMVAIPSVSGVSIIASAGLPVSTAPAYTGGAAALKAGFGLGAVLVGAILVL